jgi:hypothetical protein
MATALIILTIGIVLAAAILAFALRGGQRNDAPDPRLDSVLTAQGEIAGQFKQTVEAQAGLQKALRPPRPTLTQRLGESLDFGRKTSETPAGLTRGSA